MSKLSEYGGRIVWTDGKKTVELHDDTAKKVFQYRLTADGGIERRVLLEGGIPYPDGSPWESMSASDIRHLQSVRGQFHPILDPLGM